MLLLLLINKLRKAEFIYSLIHFPFDCLRAWFSMNACPAELILRLEDNKIKLKEALQDLWELYVFHGVSTKYISANIRYHAIINENRRIRYRLNRPLTTWSY